MTYPSLKASMTPQSFIFLATSASNSFPEAAVVTPIDPGLWAILEVVAGALMLLRRQR